jgi:hypothetical protein
MTLSWYCMDPAGVLFGQVLVASAPPGRRSPRPGLFTGSLISEARRLLADGAFKFRGFRPLGPESRFT